MHCQSHTASRVADDEEDIEGEEPVFVLIDAGDGAAPFFLLPVFSRISMESDEIVQSSAVITGTTIDADASRNGLGLEDATAIGAGVHHAAIDMGSLVVGQFIHSNW
jgi:hypothetical protein